MIRQLTGTVGYLGTDHIIVNVSGVGYQVFVSQPAAYALEQTITLHTHHAIRETASDLYGFVTMDELAIFELLIGLPKIGPKSAAQIMAQADLDLLTAAIINDDPAHLSKMSGIGKKTAEKVVLGLRDIFIDRGYTTSEATNAGAQSPARYQTDAIDALVALGYPVSDARKAIQDLPQSITTSNEAVSAALKELGKHL